MEDGLVWMIRNGPSINSWHGIDWIHLARHWYRWQALVSTVVIFIPQRNAASQNVSASEEGPAPSSCVVFGICCRRCDRCT